MRKTIRVAALAAVLLGAAYVNASSVCGDVNNSGSLTASDALAVLRAAVGQNAQLVCSALGQLPKTGQTICYNAAGTQIACSGTGQDAEFQKGAARSFTDNADGTVTDNLTGLMWEKLDDRNLGGSAGIHDKDNLYVWADTFGKISDLNGSAFAGHNDWRLPNRFEVESLVNLGAVSPATYPAFNTSCAAGCTVLTCSCTRSDFYWTSSTYGNDTTGAWIVYFVDGYADFNFKTSAYGVRAVRGGS